MLVQVHNLMLKRMIRYRYGEELGSPLSGEDEGFIEDVATAWTVQDALVRFQSLQKVLPDPMEPPLAELMADSGVAPVHQSARSGYRSRYRSSSGQSEEDLRSALEQLGAPDARTLLDRALRHPQHFLRRVYHASIDNRLELSLIKLMEFGLLRLDLTAQDGALRIRTGLEAESSTEGRADKVAAKAKSTRGAFTRLSVEASGQLTLDGSWNDIVLEGFAKNLPRLGGEDRQLIKQLLRSAKRIAEKNAPRDEREQQVASALKLAVGEQRDLVFVLLLNVLTGFTALPVLFPRRLRIEASILPDDALDHAKHEPTLEPPPPEEPALPSITWPEEDQPMIQKGAVDSAESQAARSELERLLIILPQSLAIALGAALDPPDRPAPTANA